MMMAKNNVESDFPSEPSVSSRSAAYSYQDYQIQRVSNSNGTTVAEILLVVVEPQLVFFLQVLLALCPSLGNMNRWFRFGLEYFLVIMPQLAMCTVLSDYTIYIGIASLAVCALITLVTVNRSSKLMNASMEKIQFELHNTQIFITTYRAGILLITVICILAVDFPIFPLRFAKAETYGYGLMDIGVGLFIITNSIVSREARGISSTAINRIRLAFSSSALILLLGFGRLIMVKAIGYHEHITEYGIHWNFFFTLAVTKIAASLICILLDAKHCIWMGIFLISAYQHLLSTHGFSEYILEDGAALWEGGIYYYVHVNRSGIFSCIGYVGIYLIALSLGYFLFVVKRSTIRQWIVVIAQLYSISAVLIGILWIIDHYVEAVSRRLANMAYAFWVLSFTTNVMATSLVGDIVAAIIRQLTPTLILQRKSLRRSKIDHGSKKALRSNVYGTSGSLLLATINRSGLIYFIVANLATGIVNFSAHTIYASTLQSAGILTLYTFATCLLSFYMEINNV